MVVGVPPKGPTGQRAGPSCSGRAGVAVVGVAAAVTGREPLGALLSGTVSPRLGVGPSGGRLLDPIVADGLGGADRLLDVAGLQVRSRGPRPYPGQAVRLQFLAHGQVVLPAR